MLQEQHTGLSEALRSAVTQVQTLSEQAGQLSEDWDALEQAIRLLGEAGAFRLYAPRDCGGQQASPVMVSALLAQLAAVDSGLAWIVVNCSTLCNALSRLPEAVRQEHFALPPAAIDALNADHSDVAWRNFAFAAQPYGRWRSATDDCLAVNGAWSVFTGCETASWAAVNGHAVDQDGALAQQSSLALVPSSCWQHSRSWDDSAVLQSSGSHSVTINGEISRALIVQWSDPILVDAPVYRLPATLLSIVNGTSVINGILASALDAFAADVHLRGVDAQQQAAIDKPQYQHVMREARGRWLLAREGMDALLRDLWDGVVRSGEVDPELKADYHAAGFAAINLARAIASDLYAESSRHSFVVGHPLQRALNDVHAIAATYSQMSFLHTSAGASLLGSDTIAPGY